MVNAERTAQRALLLVPTDESEVRRFIEGLANVGDRAPAVQARGRVFAVTGVLYLAAFGGLTADSVPSTPWVTWQRRANEGRANPVISG